MPEIINRLIDIGYSKEEAEQLLIKYIAWDKLPYLKSYLDLKTFMRGDNDAI